MYRKKIGQSICLLIFIALLVSVKIVYAEQLPKKFPVYDALVYKNKPDLSKYGLSTIRLVYADELWNKLTKDGHLINAYIKPEEPDPERIAEVAKEFKPDMVVCIDIEHWSVKGNQKDTERSILKFNQVTSIVRNNSPKVTFGYYGGFPITEWWTAIGGAGKMKFLEWQASNNKLTKIAENVDIVFPSLYAYYPDQKNWEKFAIEIIKESKKYKKKVFVFLWPRYQLVGQVNGNDTGQYIPIDFWRMQLEVSKKYADGIVIWGGYREEWDENAPWWIETRKFISKIQ